MYLEICMESNMMKLKRFSTKTKQKNRKRKNPHISTSCYSSSVNELELFGPTKGRDAKGRQEIPGWIPSMCMHHPSAVPPSLRCLEGREDTGSSDNYELRFVK